MNIWNIKSVTDEFSRGQMTEGKAFNYFFLVTTLNCLAFFAIAFTGVPTPLATIPFGSIVLLLDLAIVITGLIVTFRAFQRSRGDDFVQKFMCLLLPANIRAFIFCLPLFVVAGIVVYQFSDDDRRIVLAQTGALITTVMIVVQFIIIYRSMLLISEPQGQQVSAAA